jgi:hypothetical protein
MTKLKTLLGAVALFVLIPAITRAQAPTGNCAFDNINAPFTTTGNGLDFNNAVSPNVYGGGTYCSNWSITIWSTGFSGISISFQGANDNSGSPGTYADISSAPTQGTNPTITLSGLLVLATYTPWVRMKVNSVTGTGKIYFRATGAYGTSAHGGSGGGGGAGVSVSTFASLPSCQNSPFINLISNGLIDAAFCNGASAYSYFLEGHQVYPPEALNTFAWVNQSDATLTTTSGAGVLFGGSGTNIDARIRTIAAPATPYHIVMAYKWRTTDATNSMSGGCFRDSVSGKLSIATLNFQGDMGRPLIFQLSNATTQTGTPYNPGSFFFHSQGLVWFRLGDDGTNRTYDYSENGYNWYNLYSEVDSTYFTANQVCYYVNGGDGVGELSLISWQPTS